MKHIRSSMNQQVIRPTSPMKFELNLKNAIYEALWQHVKPSLMELRLQFCGPQFNILDLKEKGWDVVEKIDQCEWLQREYPADDCRKWEVRIFCHQKGFIRDIRTILFDPGASIEHIKVSVESDFPYYEDLKESLENVSHEVFLQDALSEFKALTEGWKFNGETAHMSQADILSRIWLGRIVKTKTKCPATASRLILGGVRWPGFCRNGEMLAEVALEALDLDMIQEGVHLLLQALELDDDGAQYWNLFGCSLDLLALKRLAMECFLRATKIDPIDMVYQENSWLLGKEVIKSGLKAEAYEGLLEMIADLLAFPDVVSLQDRSLTLAASALCCEGLGLPDEALDRYKMALSVDEECLVAGCGMRRIKWSSADARRNSFKNQLETFPLLPQEVGIDGRAPVNFIEGFSHGDHWLSVLNMNEGQLMSMIHSLVKDGIVLRKVTIEQNELIRNDNKEIAALAQPENAPLQALALLARENEDEPFDLKSAYPFSMEDDRVPLLVTSLEEWGNGIEGSVVARRKNRGELIIFDPLYFANKKTYLANHWYHFQLAGFIYELHEPHDHEFEISSGPLLQLHKLEQQRGNHADDDEPAGPVKVSMSPDFRMLSPSFDFPSEYEFRLPILDFEWTELLGHRTCKITTMLDDDEVQYPITLYAGEHLFKDFTPKPHKYIEGMLWLQGRLLSDEGKLGTIPLSEDSPFGKALFSKSYDFDTLAEGALQVASDGFSTLKGLRSYTSIPYRIGDEPHFVLERNDGQRAFVSVLGVASKDDWVSHSEMQSSNTPKSSFSPHFLVGVGFSKVGDGWAFDYHNWEELEAFISSSNNELSS